MAEPYSIERFIMVFRDIYPNRPCTVELSRGVYKRLKANSKTLWPGENEHIYPHIAIDIKLPRHKAESELAHRLAHVATGCREHGSDWRSALDRIKTKFKEEL